MNYEDFKSSGLISPADFNIGGVRVSNAEMDYSGVSDEMLALKGIAKIRIDLQDAEKRTAAEGLDLDDVKDKNTYLERLKERAIGLSGSTIDMAVYIGKPSWNFQKGVGGDPVKKAGKEIDKVSDEQALLDLQAKIDARLEALKK